MITHASLKKSIRTCFGLHTCLYLLLQTTKNIMLKQLSIVLLLTASNHIAHAQSQPELQVEKPTQVQWQVSTNISELSHKYVSQNKKDGKIDGYRVQLFFGARDQAQEVRTRFLKLYPDMDAEIDYLAPNFRVRVGNFRSHLDAFRFHKKINSDFNGSYIVQDRIDLPKLSSIH